MDKATKQNLVQKSYPLVNMIRKDWSLIEYKLLDIYLSRINSHDNTQCVVEIAKGEIEDMMGIKYIRKEQLDKHLEKLLTINVNIPDDKSDNPKGIRRITLFSEAKADPQPDGTWTVTLECSQKARQYIFNIEHLGYIKYHINKICMIKSLYSYRMFLYLISNQHRGSWKVSIEDLQKIFGCEDDLVYHKYKYFNDKILKRVHTEISEKGLIQYTYSPVKAGNMILGIRIAINMAKNEDKGYCTPISECAV